MTKAERKLVKRIKLLYEEHDHSEWLLVLATRRYREVYGLDLPDSDLWTHHNALERVIISAEARLPQHIVEKLKRGEL